MKPTTLDLSDPIQKDFERLLIIVQGIDLRTSELDDDRTVTALKDEARRMIKKYEKK